MIRRNHVRRTLLRIQERYPEHRDAICKILANENLLSQVVDHAKSFGIPPKSGSGEFPILEWLWDHRQQIIQFILTLISMLGVGS